MLLSSYRSIFFVCVFVFSLNARDWEVRLNVKKVDDVYLAWVKSPLKFRCEGLEGEDVEVEWRCVKKPKHVKISKGKGMLWKPLDKGSLLGRAGVYKFCAQVGEEKKYIKLVLQDFKGFVVNKKRVAFKGKVYAGVNVGKTKKIEVALRPLLSKYPFPDKDYTWKVNGKKVSSNADGNIQLSLQALSKKALKISVQKRKRTANRRMEIHPLSIKIRGKEAKNGAQFQVKFVGPRAFSKKNIISASWSNVYLPNSSNLKVKKTKDLSKHMVPMTYVSGTRRRRTIYKLYFGRKVSRKKTKNDSVVSVSVSVQCKGIDEVLTTKLTFLVRKRVIIQED